MGGSHSREDLEIDSSDEDYADDESDRDPYVDAEDDGRPQRPQPSSSSGGKYVGSVDEIDARLKELKVKYHAEKPNLRNPVKLYLHIGGSTPKAKWVISDKLTSYDFVRCSSTDGGDGSGDDESEGGIWVLKVGAKVRARVSTEMQLKMFGDQRRVDFVNSGVWAMKFWSDADYRSFVTQYQNCLFENVYGLEATDENKLKVYGREFIGWVKPEAADDSVWEDAEDDLGKSPEDFKSTPSRANPALMEEFEEAANGGVQSLTLGALDNSFLVNDSGVQVYRNYAKGIRGKGIYVKFDRGTPRDGSSSPKMTPTKAMLMRGETNMMLMSPLKEGKPQSTGLQQLDIETGKIVTEWKFEKDGTDITMRDITNDTKGAQLDPSESTFLGLDDNRLCQWDMRDRRGIVQNIASADSPVLNWTQGHQFSRGTNFQCFATTGDGSIVVGSLDGKIRLYSKTSMRQAKTAFPGLGSPITHVDVTYDGKWVLGTTDTYLILICTLFTDKDGRTKTGFSGRMGNKIPAPRLLKLTPLDSHLAGENNKFHGGHFSWVSMNFLLCFY